jgi:hypothetical protein
MSVIRWDENTRRYFARTFENHGLYRHYDVTVEGKVWMISGEFERAHRVPLCDRVATKVK